jgi:ribosomal protein S18 acetylase RimI-like enzyme
VISYRAFRNTDPPGLAEVWRSQTTHGGIMQPMSATVLERYVLSRPIFDPQGLTVATEGDAIVGFAHAGFGPNEDRSALSTQRGVTSVLMWRQQADPATGMELLARSEAYLRARGATELVGGGAYPLVPFYYGLYGGSELSGVLENDRRARQAFEQHGYREASQFLVLRRELAGFRPAVDRQQMQIHRQTTLETVVDAPTTNWWDSIIFEPFERTQCYLQPRGGCAPAASVHFWNMETMSSTLGVHAVGIVGTHVTESQRRQGLAKYLLGEALRQLHAQGVALAEVHVGENNPAALALFCGLGFVQVDRGIVYSKE